MTVRLLLDEMYPPALADVLNQRGYDVLAVATMLDLVGVDDQTVLAAATADRRCLVTENVRDFASLARYVNHNGVLLVNGKRWRRTRDGVHRLATAMDKAVINGHLPGAGEVGWLA
ncbi:MAG TPA: DUF5615 family PIN-like protein [Mycobacteriales bacterium]|nr:DUF5615 family PIN-like protein [Mycobacteriales bacterium]